MPSITIICPTRKRPGHLERQIASARETASDFDALEWVVPIATDDDTPHDFTGANVRVVPVTSSMVLSDRWTYGAAFSQAPVLMWAGDDICFRTPGWDTIAQEAFPPDGIALVGGSDGNPRRDGRFITHGFLHRAWVEAVGYFVPLGFHGDGADLWVNDMARALGRWIHIPILTEHLHPAFGKAPQDEVYRTKAQNAASRATYDLRLGERDRDIELLRAVMS